MDVKKRIIHTQLSVGVETFHNDMKHQQYDWFTEMSPVTTNERMEKCPQSRENKKPWQWTITTNNHHHHNNEHTTNHGKRRYRKGATDEVNCWFFFGAASQYRVVCCCTINILKKNRSQQLSYKRSYCVLVPSNKSVFSFFFCFRIASSMLILFLELWILGKLKKSKLKRVHTTIRTMTVAISSCLIYCYHFRSVTLWEILVEA